MIIPLENQKFRISIDPERGTSILSFLIKKQDLWLPLMPDSRLPEVSLRSSSFLMIPYSNRIKDGAFFFQGTCHQLARAQEHAIHGDVQERSWEVKSSKPEKLICSFDSRKHQTLNWPWNFSAQVSYELKNNVFCSQITLKNQDRKPMPAGLGWHPYFNRELTQKNEPVLLSFSAQGVYPDDNNDRIPSGPPRNLTSEQNFSRLKELRSDFFLDTCFRGFNGTAIINWPQSKIKLTLKASKKCNHLVVYNPLNTPYFAVEPVTNANNGVNLLDRGDKGAGVVILAPEEKLSAKISFRVESK